jgi:hypothetical protein
MKAYGEVEVYLRQSCPRHYNMEKSGHLHVPAALTPGGITHGTHCTGGWVAPRADLDVTEKRESLAPTGSRTLS